VAQTALDAISYSSLFPDIKLTIREYRPRKTRLEFNIHIDRWLGLLENTAKVNSEKKESKPLWDAIETIANLDGTLDYHLNNLEKECAEEIHPEPYCREIQKLRSLSKQISSISSETSKVYGKLRDQYWEADENGYAESYNDKVESELKKSPEIATTTDKTIAELRLKLPLALEICEQIKKLAAVGKKQ
jgi:hypothetical protein